MKKVMTVFGTRPEAIKMAPLVKQIEAVPEFQSVVAVTAQHREMLDQVLEIFDLRPDYDLNIMQSQQTLYDITTRVLQGLAEIIEKEKPDILLVHGDTTTTFIASLAAFYQQIPVGHVEAGLRTKNKYSPFPEEMNRRLTGVLADVHFAPTDTAAENLLQEGKDPDTVFVTGNTVIDALLSQIDRNYSFADTVLQKIDFSKRIILVTTHRRENWGRPLADIYTALRRIVEEHDDVELIFPIHKNPLVRETAAKYLGQHERIHTIEPLSYLEFIHVLHKSFMVLTDSGGIQEEAPSLGKPVLVLRENTERPEAVTAGTVKLIGTEQEKVWWEIKYLLDSKEEYKKMSNAINPYGDGKAAERICDYLLYYFGYTDKKSEKF